MEGRGETGVVGIGHVVVVALIGVWSSKNGRFRHATKMEVVGIVIRIFVYVNWGRRIGVVLNWFVGERWVGRIRGSKGWLGVAVVR